MNDEWADIETQITLALMYWCHFPGVFARFVSRIVIIRIMSVAGGSQLYIPSLSNTERDSEIKLRFKGRNYKQLAVDFDISERQIRRIVHGN